MQTLGIGILTFPLYIQDKLITKSLNNTHLFWLGFLRNDDLQQNALSKHLSHVAPGPNFLPLPCL